MYGMVNTKVQQMTANEEQVGGGHYKGASIEHWDFVLMHNIPYMEAQVIKYMMRWRKKNGIEDLRKAEHFIRKLIEVELQQPQEDVKPPTMEGTLEEARQALDNPDAMNMYMNPDSGVPRGKGYVDQD